MQHDDLPTAAMRLAVIFAADCEPSAIAACSEDEPTDTHADLATRVGFEAIRLSNRALAHDEDFYRVAFVEAAANYFNSYPNATFEQVCEAGQLESDSIAGK